MISGGVITWKGRYKWWLILSPLIATVAGGLLFTIDAGTSSVLFIQSFCKSYILTGVHCPSEILTSLDTRYYTEQA